MIDEISRAAAWWRASAALDAPAEAPPPSTPMMTTTEAAAALGVTTSRVRQLLRAGELAAERSDGRWHIDPADVNGRT